MLSVSIKIFFLVGTALIVWGGWMIVYGFWEFKVFQSSDNTVSSIAIFITENWNYLKFELLKVLTGIIVLFFGLLLSPKSK